MISDERVQELKKLLEWVYFVGFGFWPNEDAFALGMTPPDEMFIRDVLNSEILTILVERLGQYKPGGWVLKYFIVTREAGLQSVTKEEAEWIADHRANY